MMVELHEDRNQACGRVEERFGRSKGRGAWQFCKATSSRECIV